MTLTIYAARVTEIMLEHLGPEFEFPDSFDSDVEACFTQRMAPEQAAEDLSNDYFPES